MIRHRLTIWILSTLTIYILLATAVMFSRQTTLDGVRIFDFKIFVNAVHKLNNKSLLKDFKFITDTLTIENGKIVFFPVAILTKDSCVENGSRTDLICSKYSNLQRLQNMLTTAKSRDYYGAKIYDLSDGNSYLYKKLDENLVLVGETGKYIIKNRLESFYLFMKDDWPRYFLRINSEGGKYGAMLKTWQKTEFIFWLTISISFILYILHLLYIKQKEKVYQTLKDRIDNSTDQLNKLNDEFASLFNSKLEVENNIIKLNQANEDISHKTSIYKEKIQKYEDEQKKINDLISNKKQEIILTEHLEDDIVKEIKNKVNTIDVESMSKELERLIDKLHNIRKLWQRDLTWKERKSLESNITGYDRVIPFTISQSFILFEKEIIIRMAKTCYNFSEEMGLFEMIGLIADSKKYDVVIINKLHKIRKARNQWSHTGKLPENAVINDLLSVLELYKVEPTF